jgi:hypothetical protein
VYIDTGDGYKTGFDYQELEVVPKSITEESIPSVKTKEDVLKQINKIVKNGQAQHVKLPDNKQYLMDVGTANMILQINDALKDESNKEKFGKMLMSTNGLMTLVDFAWKHASFGNK